MSKGPGRPKCEGGMKKLCIQIPASMANKLDALAKVQGIKRHALMVNAIKKAVGDVI